MLDWIKTNSNQQPVYFNQSATHLSKNQHQTIPKTRQQQIHTNTKKKKKRKKAQSTTKHQSTKV